MTKVPIKNVGKLCRMTNNHGFDFVANGQSAAIFGKIGASRL